MKYVNVEGEKGNLIYLDDGRFSESRFGFTMDGESYYDYDKMESDRDYWKFLCEALKNGYEYDFQLLYHACKIIFGFDIVSDDYIWHDKIHDDVKILLNLGPDDTIYFCDDTYKINKD